MKLLSKCSLSKKDKVFINDTRDSMEVADKLLGKPILGTWPPLGIVRDPETSENPELAKKLIKL